MLGALGQCLKYGCTRAAKYSKARRGCPYGRLHGSAGRAQVVSVVSFAGPDAGSGGVDREVVAVTAGGDGGGGCAVLVLD